jgi:hypothetical protein
MPSYLLDALITDPAMTTVPDFILTVLSMIALGWQRVAKIIYWLIQLFSYE